MHDVTRMYKVDIIRLQQYCYMRNIPGLLSSSATTIIIQVPTSLLEIATTKLFDTCRRLMTTEALQEQLDNSVFHNVQNFVP